MFKGILITKGDAGYKAELQNIEAWETATGLGMSEFHDESVV